MADQDKRDDNSSRRKKKSKLPEGRRVVRKKRRSSKNRETMILSNREILGEMIDEEVDQPVDVRGQVDRLRRAQKEQKRNTDPPMEEKWGAREHRRKGSRWLPVAIFLIVVPLLVFVILTSLNQPATKSEEVRGGNTLNLDEDDAIENPFEPTDPLTWFHENSVEAYDDCVEILDRINETENALEALPMMRDAEVVEERIRETNFSWDADFNVSDPRKISWEYGSSDDIGYMVIKGVDTVFNPFRAYFVKTQNGVKMDWAATTAWSEMPVGKLEEESPPLPVYVRCWLVKKPHFDSDTNNLISWYQILGPEKLDFVWAYTPTDSEVDEELKELLNYGRVLMGRVNEERMILRLRAGGPGRRDNEFELVEFVAKDWVQP